MAPNQPRHNLQDDLSPGNSKQANTSSSSPDATFAHLQRAHKSGGVTPEYPSDGGVPIAGAPGGGSD